MNKGNYMKTTFKWIQVLATICLILFTVQTIQADDLKDAKSQVGKYVDLTSIPSTYQIHNATDRDNVKQITFINLQTRQRMSITFGKYMTAKNEKELADFVEALRKNDGTGSEGRISSKITSFKSLNAHNQSIPYFNVNQYDNGKLWTKAMIGAIGNYNGKFIIIQSYSAPENYNEQEMKIFFSKIKLKTEAF